MGKLAEMPNIGVRLEELLIIAGIDSPEKLIGMGSRDAWLLIKEINPSLSLTRLYSLEGAIRGVKWHQLPAEVRDELKRFAEESARKY